MSILVITDNILQYERMRLIVQRKGVESEFDFRHSPKSPLEGHVDFVGKSLAIDVNTETQRICNKYSLVISMHCLQFFPAQLVKNIRCINIHPGYNPINRGWYPQVFALAKGLAVGATIHEMDEKLDNGPIICRSFVVQHAWDTSLSLYNRILDKEIELLDSNFEKIISGDYQTTLPEKRGTIYSRQDFQKLCELNLSETGTFREFLNRLRALSHGEFKNAYFIDPESQTRVSVKIELERGE